MTPERLFSILNLLTMAAWLALLLRPRARWANTVVPVAVPVVLSLVYVVLIGVAALRASSEGMRLADDARASRVAQLPGAGKARSDL